LESAAVHVGVFGVFVFFFFVFFIQGALKGVPTCLSGFCWSRKARSTAASETNIMFAPGGPERSAVTRTHMLTPVMDLLCQPLVPWCNFAAGLCFGTWTCNA
jgi:hypothetical protein